MQFAAFIEEWEMKTPFRITGAVWTNSRSLVVQLSQDGQIGRGEAQGVYYLDETAESLLAQVVVEARRPFS